MSNLTQFTKKLAKLKTINFTSSGTFTVPTGVTTILVTMCGGGGGYRKDSYNDKYSYIAGGGGGYHLNTPVAVTPGNTLTINVGAGGTSSYGQFGNNGSYWVVIWYGTVTDGGTSSIFDGATKLIEATGGSYGLDVTNSSYVYGFGNGGWPNGAGGGAFGTARAGSSGYGGTSSLGLTTIPLGVNANSSAGAGAVGLGVYPGAGYYSGGNPIPGGYGIGADTYGSYSTSSRTPGGNGIVQISYFEV
jgi:hypothetical protein